MSKKQLEKLNEHPQQIPGTSGSSTRWTDPPRPSAEVALAASTRSLEPSEQTSLSHDSDAARRPHARPRPGSRREGEGQNLKTRTTGGKRATEPEPPVRETRLRGRGRGTFGKKAGGAGRGWPLRPRSEVQRGGGWAAGWPTGEQDGRSCTLTSRAQDPACDELPAPTAAQGSVARPARPRRTWVPDRTTARDFSLHSGLRAGGVRESASKPSASVALVT